MVTPKGIKVEHSFRLGFKTSNNETEYEALLVELRATLSFGSQKLEIYSDSRLVVSQVEGSFEAKDLQMIIYFKLVNETMNQFKAVRVI